MAVVSVDSHQSDLEVIAPQRHRICVELQFHDGCCVTKRSIAIEKGDGDVEVGYSHAQQENTLTSVARSERRVCSKPSVTLSTIVIAETALDTPFCRIQYITMLSHNSIIITQG